MNEIKGILEKLRQDIQDGKPGSSTWWAYSGMDLLKNALSAAYQLGKEQEKLLKHVT